MTSAFGTGITAGLSLRTPEELTAYLPTITSSPAQDGILTQVIARPAPGERDILDEGALEVSVGLVGDNWLARGSSRTADGSAHPEMQLNVINYRLIEFLSFGDPQCQAEAGDQLHVDLDLSHANLPVGTRLTFADPELRGAVIEVTEPPHTGCKKFVARYGPEAMRFVNGEVGRSLRLRGLNAKVVVPGRIRPGDVITVTRPGSTPSSEQNSS